LQSSQAQWSEVIKVLAVLTMILGNIVAMVQSNVKRMLAYSSIAHAGYVLVGIATGTLAGYNAVLFYLFAYTIMNVGAFGVIAYYERTKGVDMTLLDNYAGLGFKNPLMGVLLSIFLFSLVGIPPMIGFIGKYLVFAAAIQSGFIVLAIIGMLASAAGAFYYLRVMVFMYMKESEVDITLERSGNVYALSLTILAVATVVFGIMGDTLMTIIASF
jgi:NADH-quinone oxidoreductase subunit N